MDRSYKCRILQHFPEHAKTFSFDGESTALVTMPNGLNLFVKNKSKTVNYLKPQVHTFIITREDGTRVYGLALVFTEIVNDERLKTSLETLEMMYDSELKLKKCSRLRYEKNKDFLFSMKVINTLF